jgi:hypothetical protein
MRLAATACLECVGILKIAHNLESQLSIENVLNSSSSNGNHGKAAVNDFRFLSLGQAIWRQLADEIRAVPSQITWLSITVVHVEGGKLNGSHTKENLDIDGETDSGWGTEWIGVDVRVTRKVDSCGLDDHTDNGKHGDASVLEFGPTSVVEVGCVLGSR